MNELVSQALPPPLPPPLSAATIVDTVGTAALVTLSPRGGMSLNINVTYLGKTPAGGNLLIEAQVRLLGGWQGGGGGAPATAVCALLPLISSPSLHHNDK